MPHILKSTGLSLIMLSLAACAGVSAPRSGIAPFQTVLAEEYGTLARQQRNAFDLIDYAHFSKKASRAEKGRVVEPDSPNSRNLKESDYPKIWTGWTWLKNMPEHMRLAYPRDVARAQVAFDCWLEQREEESNRSMKTSCEKNWDALIAQLECPAGCDDNAGQDLGNLEKSYDVLFAVNSTDIDEGAEAVINRAVQDIKALSQKNVTVMLTGYTDRAGSRSYNAALAQKRADAVARHLIEKGISEDQIKTNARGEAGQAIITDDDVKLQENRRVKIDVFQ